MSDIEQAWLTSPSRRKAMARMAALIAASPLGKAVAQPDPRPFDEVYRALTLPEVRTIFDFQPLFMGNVARQAAEYTNHGDGSEFTLRRNRQAFDWVDIVPRRGAVAASDVDLSTDILGVKLKYPIIVGPSSGQGDLHPDAEIGMFQGATAASNTLFILSANSTLPITRVAPAVPGATIWAQHYPIENLTNAQRTLDTYQNAGATAIMVTVDQQASYYERDLLNRNFGGRVTPAGRGGRAGGGRAAAAPAAGSGGEAPPAAAGAIAAASTGVAAPAPAAVTGAARYRLGAGRLWYTWQYIEAVRKMTKGKLLVKGIVDPEDAKLAIEHGVDAILVSNHGGRSMDYGPSTLEVLPAIVAAVNGRIPVLFDSGIRRGSDIFKALALGANGICLGRAARWGLGAFGAPGAQRAVEILQQELVQVAAAAGCSKLSDINKSLVKTAFV